jgi:hypothetical protein
VFISLGELVFFVTREKGRETTTKEMLITRGGVFSVKVVDADELGSPGCVIQAARWDGMARVCR